MTTDWRWVTCTSMYVQHSPFFISCLFWSPFFQHLDHASPFYAHAEASVMWSVTTSCFEHVVTIINAHLHVSAQFFVPGCRSRFTAVALLRLCRDHWRRISIDECGRH